MTKDQIKALVRSRIEGQGTQIDASSVLPSIFNGILDLMAEGGEVGDLADLSTGHKSDLVSAINELARLVETPHYVISFTKTADELKEIYNACSENLVLAKNIVFYNATDELYYRVNGYAMVSGVLKLHTIMAGESGLADTVVNLSSNGTLSVG